MSGQYFGERFNTSDNPEGTNQYSNSPAVNSDVFADKTPVDAALIHETPMGGTVASVGPLNGPVADEIPMYQTPVQEIPMGGTVAAVRPLDETIVYEAAVVETVPYRAPVIETTSVKPWENKSIPNNYNPPTVETVTPAVPVATNASASAALLNSQDSEHFRTRWNEIQGKFVDEPRTAVQQADTLVSDVVEQITQMFAKERGSLEGQWKQGNDVSTEDLRKALQHYRSFFNRLVV